ncbi:serine hydrolase [Microbacterium sp.]|uniref:serine hydrolase n=1 Tax=Microbacterium sp. TaxID=51671 RepID=UPI00333F12A0
MSRLTIDDFFAIATPEQPALSPDGLTIAYVLRTVDRDADRDVRSLWAVPADGGEPRRLTRGTADSTPAWSPDGETLAFLRAAEDAVELWLLPAFGGEAARLATLPRGARSPRWSPDGTRIAFSAPVDMTTIGGGEPSPSSAPVVADDLRYKLDGVGVFGTMRSQVHVIDIGDGKVTRLTDGPEHTTDPFWSPDGTRLAFSMPAAEDSDLTMSSAVFTVDAGHPARHPVRVGGEGFQTTAVGWTDDGAHIAAAGRLDVEVGHIGLLLIPVDGGEPVDLTAALDRNVMAGGPGYPGALPQRSADGRHVLCVRENGFSQVISLAPDGSDRRELVGGTANVSGVSVAGDRAAVVVGTDIAFADVALLDLRDGTLRTLTSYGAPAFPLAVAEERRFTISDGTVVTGWLRRPAGAEGPLPLLLDIHGGPHNAWNGAADLAHPYQQLLIAEGWAVLTVNPRGSDGYGEAFYRGVTGDWGLSDARDFLEPIDRLVEEGVLDPERLTVTGYSYGGFMTCYLTSRDDRFAAAVPGGVVTDLVSFGGTSDVGHYLASSEHGGLPWRDAERLRAQSPYTQVDRVVTPTLILHGAADDRCPVGQAEQWFTALQERDVPSRLVLYPGASHLFPITGAPSQRADFNARITGWMQQHVPADARPTRPRIDAAHWQQRLNAIASKHRVPGASLGILRLGEEPAYGAYGVLSARTGLTATPGSVFQIGSITKVWTATAALRLVERGDLDLDTPIVRYLPEFRVPSEEITQGVTLRHLLTHTSGIDGDFVAETGQGDDALDRFLGELADVPQNHPLGATFSYCNSGFSLVGNVIERVTGKTWDEAMRELVFEPLGLPGVTTRPEEAIMQRAAIGHTGLDDDGPVQAGQWSLPRSMGPAGLINASSADVLAFARMHLEGGVAVDGTRVLSEDLVAEMQRQQVEVPDPYTLGSAWGLGWMLFDWDGRRVFGHDGTTIGQYAFLRVLPEEGLAIVLLTNGVGGKQVMTELFREIFAELADLRVPGGLAMPDEPFDGDVDRVLGTYERAGVTADVFREESGDGLRVRVTLTGPLASMLPNPVQEHRLVPVDDREFVIPVDDGASTMPVIFYTLPTGELYMHTGIRAAPKVP